MATWGLASDGVLYAMVGEEYESKLTLTKTKDGDIIIPPQKFNVVVDMNSTAEIPKPLTVKASEEILLPVVFWCQTDNYRDANRTCFSSSMAMITERLLPDKLTGDDQYVEAVFSIPGGDTTDPSTQIQALEKFGVQGTYRQDMDFDDLDSELAAGYAVGIGILHRGPLESPTGGHWIVVRGHNADKSVYWVNDPYGSIGSGYQGPVEEGKCAGYSREMLKARWTADGPGSGWGMTCRKKQ